MTRTEAEGGVVVIEVSAGGVPAQCHSPAAFGFVPASCLRRGQRSRDGRLGEVVMEEVDEPALGRGA